MVIQNSPGKTQWVTRQNTQKEQWEKDVWRGKTVTGNKGKEERFYIECPYCVIYKYNIFTESLIRTKRENMIIYTIE